MKLVSLKNEKFNSFEQNKITNPMSIFGGVQTTTRASDGVKDSMDMETTQRGVSCNSKPCDYRRMEMAFSTDVLSIEDNTTYSIIITSEYYG